VKRDDERMEELRKANDAGTLTINEAEELEHRRKHEWQLDGELLYEQTRMVMGAVWVNCIIHAYSDCLFHELQPEPIPNGMTDGPGCGVTEVTGFHVSYEFNIIYRFHTCIPEYWNVLQGMLVDGNDDPADDKLNEIQEGKGLFRDYVHSAAKAEAAQNKAAMKEEGRLKIRSHFMERKSQGHVKKLSKSALMTLMNDAHTSTSKDDRKDNFWNDDKLVSVLTEAMVTPMGAFGLHNTHEFMIAMGIENKAIEDARKMGCCRLNEFRTRIGMPRYKSIDELAHRDRRWFSSDEDYERAVLEAREDVEVLKAIYKHIDNVELAVGYMCEQATNAGLGFSDTLGLGIIADAFSSIRQDKFYQTRFAPQYYTQWGYDHARTCCMQDLLNRHLEVPYVDRGTSILRLPQNWRYEHERIKVRSRIERHGLNNMRHLGVWITKFQHGTLDEHEGKGLLNILENCDHEHIALVMTVQSQRGATAAKRQAELQAVVDDPHAQEVDKKVATVELKDIAKQNKLLEEKKAEGHRVIKEAMQATLVLMASSHQQNISKLAFKLGKLKKQAEAASKKQLKQQEKGLGCMPRMCS